MLMKIACLIISSLSPKSILTPIRFLVKPSKLLSKCARLWCKIKCRHHFLFLSASWMEANWSCNYNGIISPVAYKKIQSQGKESAANVQIGHRWMCSRGTSCIPMCLHISCTVWTDKRKVINYKLDLNLIQNCIRM